MDPPARIVIVEDEAIPALDVARRLRRLGYQVVAVASSGPQAVEYALTCDPDVVLMDIHLHGAMAKLAKASFTLVRNYTGSPGRYHLEQQQL
jgi:CheY-like chemotaxis protein